MKDQETVADILVVDDTMENLDVLVSMLSEYGYNVRPAPSGEIALRAAHSVPPDLILLDIRMPDMDGYQVCRALKDDDRTRDIPIIFLTVLDEAMEKVRAFAVGAVDYITKPFQGEEVLARVQTHLSLRNLQKRLQEQNTLLEWEIAKRERTEEALRDREHRLKRAQEMAHVGFWELDLTADRLVWSDELYRIFGLNPQESAATHEGFLDAVHPDDRAGVDAAYSESVREGSDQYEIEHRVVRRRTGEIRHVHEKCEHMRDMSGKIIRSLGIVQDVTERKKAEEQVKASLREKEVLLREIHHRVKNNLALVCSLLTLHAEHADETHSSLFEDLAERVMSMALAHERLYQSESLANLDLDDYVDGLIDHLVGSAGPESSIHLSKEIHDISFGLDTAIPVGFILTELVSNCLKHAFPDGREGEIRISLRSIPDNRFELVVSDNGVGMPEDFALANATSLGMKLVDAFLIKLEGSMEIFRDKGTQLRLEFKEI